MPATAPSAPARTCRWWSCRSSSSLALRSVGGPGPAVFRRPDGSRPGPWRGVALPWPVLGRARRAGRGRCVDRLARLFRRAGARATTRRRGSSSSSWGGGTPCAATTSGARRPSRPAGQRCPRWPSGCRSVGSSSPGSERSSRQRVACSSVVRGRGGHAATPALTSPTPPHPTPAGQPNAEPACALRGTPPCAAASRAQAKRPGPAPSPDG